MPEIMDVSAPRKNIIAWQITILIMSICYLPNLFTRGMFVDGVTYASIGRNLALGYGSFWKPFYIHSFYPVFYEHPPLVFYMISIFFRAFGDFFWVERIYSLCTFIFSTYLIHRIWIDIVDKPDRSLSWLPVLLWSITPIISWSYSNNMLENTMGVFCLLATWQCVLFLQNRVQKWRLVLVVLFIFAGIFSKGPIALFPIAIPVIFYFVYFERKNRIDYIYTIAITAALVFLFGIVNLSPDAHSFLINYLHSQILASLNGQREQVESHFHLLYPLFLHLLPMMGLYIIAFIGYKFKILERRPGSNRQAVLFLIIGLSASLPIMISIKQSEYYLVPSIPYFGLGIALLLKNYQAQRFKKDINRLTFRISLICLSSGLIGLIFISISSYGKICREENLINISGSVSKTVPAGSTIKICEGLNTDWGLRANLQRYGLYDISIDGPEKYYISGKSCGQNSSLKYLKTQNFGEFTFCSQDVIKFQNFGKK
jgi:4-amino-4-deoxy-L-arabinose transferase-like glycosyltransferase